VCSFKKKRPLKNYESGEIMKDETLKRVEVVETKHGHFELIKNYRDCFDTLSFSERYVDYLDRYEYIVGDYSADMLRLKGFSAKQKDQIFDYLMESATPHAPYFILRRKEVKK